MASTDLNPNLLPQGVTFDGWLSEKLRKKCYSLKNTIDVATVKNWISRHRDALFVSGRFPVQSPVVGQLLSQGFKLTEHYAKLSAQLQDLEPFTLNSKSIRYARPIDEADVGRIAFEAFVNSRFHQDPIVDNQLASSLKQAWAQNFFSGIRGDAMLVATRGEAVLGFNQILHRSNEAIIDLIATCPSRQNQGVGPALIQAFFEHARSNNLQRVSVGTQIHNHAAMAAYQKMGFTVESVHSTLHFHS